MVPTSFEIGATVNGWVLTEYDIETETIMSYTFYSTEKLIEVLRDRMYAYREVFNRECEIPDCISTTSLAAEEELPKCMIGVEFEDEQPKRKRRRRIPKK
jgi:hypothetical protein